MSCLEKNHLFKITVPLLYVSGVFLLVIDRFLKWQAQNSWKSPRLFGQFFGWDPFINPGIAFGIPVPSWLVITVTIPVVGLLCYLLIRSRQQFSVVQSHSNSAVQSHPTNSASAVQSNPNSAVVLSSVASYLFILDGTLSNLIDRILYHHTIDYWRVFTAVINLADILIVVGFILLIARERLYVKTETEAG